MRTIAAIAAVLIATSTSAIAGLTVQGTSLQGTSLQGTSLQGTSLQGTSLQGTSLQGTSLQGTSLQGTPLQGTPLQGTSLQGSLLQGMRVSSTGSGLSGSLILPPGGYTPSYHPCPFGVGGYGTGRTCGWVGAGTGTCTPGSAVTVYTSGSCSSDPYGHDSMLRVCSGAFPCEAGSSSVLGANDDFSGRCSQVTFTCPSAARFNVMTANYYAGYATDFVPTAAGATSYPEAAWTQSLNACPNTQWGLARNCGWAYAGIYACTAGTAVTVSTNTTGSYNDSMLRVCDGIGPCDSNSTRVVAANDDISGSNYLSSASFTCPSASYYTVMVAPYYTAYQPTFGVSSTSGSPIKKTLSGIDFEGMELNYNYIYPLPNGTPSRMRFTKIDAGYTFTFPLTASGEQTQSIYHPDIFAHHVDYAFGCTTPGCTNWTSLCASDPTAGVDPLAILFYGYWDSTGAFVADSNFTSIQCMDTVPSKCANWGYKPWKSGWRNYHQTCTRAARADYCGDGRSWTEMDHPIQIWDLANYQKYDPVASTSPYTMAFDAAWGPNGAVCWHGTYRNEELGDPSCGSWWHPSWDTTTYNPTGLYAGKECMDIDGRWVANGTYPAWGNELDEVYGATTTWPGGVYIVTETKPTLNPL